MKSFWGIHFTSLTSFGSPSVEQATYKFSLRALVTYTEVCESIAIVREGNAIVRGD